MKHIALFWLIVSVVCLFPRDFSGSIRTVYTNDKAMTPVFLSMGQSTVLRFRDKPKKIVIGNQNYFNVEFIDNDIALQPQGVVKSNIFIYTENQTYGLILSAGRGVAYDDLVYIQWKNVIQVNQSKEPKGKKVKEKKKIPYETSFRIKDVLKIDVMKLTNGEMNGIIIIDLELQNITNEKIASHNIKIKLTADGKDLPYQRAIIEKEELSASENSKARVIVKSKEAQEITINVNYKEIIGKLVIPKGAL